MRQERGLKPLGRCRDLWVGIALDSSLAPEVERDSGKVEHTRGKENVGLAQENV